METTITSFLSKPEVLPFLKSVPPWVIALIVIWAIVWKGLALWKAARLSSKTWFTIILLVNTVGILEIIYIFFVARKYSVETEKQV